ncbi:30S ribosomal protein S6 [Chondrinema litorale]|uniref:30S ribosomal protein S6 n=1 Tax=Chondrinema litorale TaxID=2994555 RepID=UPI0025440B22|nr:30S ribosomal protein S6 [Chondrinema litorale]UZR93773.1 30S ribosomal protein S6 [Chondrinema litorale]
MSLKHYETVFIITPILSEQEIEETVAKFKSWLEEQKAEIYHAEKWGLKKLAYPIDNKTTGVYQLFEFKADPTVIQTLEIEYKRDEKILRFLTVSLDKYGVEFNEKRRSGAFKKKSETSKEEVAS